MRVLLTVTRATNVATGPTVAIAGLHRSLLRRKITVSVHGVAPRFGTRRSGAQEHEQGWVVHRVATLVPGFETMRISRSMLRALGVAVANNDVIHNNGMWAGITTITAHLAVRAGRPVVWSPRGTLDPVALRGRRISKGIQWRLLQGKLLRSVDCFHATSDHEARHIREQGLRSPIAVVPHGVDISPTSRQSARTNGRRKLLFLSRLAPIKGIPLLLDAWSALEPHYPDWDLVLAGPDSRGHREELEKRVQTRGLERVSFLGEVQGADKARAFAEADLFVLPSRAENFGLAIAEAMAHSLPVIVTHGTPWQEVKSKRCGWWIERTEDALVDTLRTAMELPDQERLDMGRRGQAWMRAEFSWDAIACKMEATYRWMAGGGQPPPWVRTV